MKRNIIPFYLEAPTQLISTPGNHSWNGLSSRIDCSSGANNINLSIDANPTQGRILPGTILVVYWSAGTISAGMKLNVMYGGSTIHSLDSSAESVTLMFFDDKDSQDDPTWVTLANESANGNLSTNSLSLSGDLLVGGTISSAGEVLFLSNVSTFGNTAIGNEATDTVAFFGAEATSQLEATEDVAAAENLPETGTGAGGTYTQAEVTACIETIHSLIATVNQLKSDLVTLGLKASE